jgi:ribosomal protein S18 acetylase RimI-like enzyme
MIIRSVNQGDLDRLYLNYKTYYKEYKENLEFGKLMFEPDCDSHTRWFSKLMSWLNSGDAVAFVASTGNDIVGFCQIKRNIQDWSNHIGTLGISITKDYRGMGIGKKLIINSIAASKGIFEIISLDVISSNIAAISLYKKIGFDIYGIAPRFIKRSETYRDLYLMYLNVNSFKFVQE